MSFSSHSSNFSNESQRLQKIIRESIKQERQNLPPEYRALASLKIAKQIISALSKADARHIGVYFATPYEVDLNIVIDWAFQHQKNIYVPRIKVLKNKENREDVSLLEFVLVTPSTQIESGKFGIREPKNSENDPIISVEALDVVLVPLVAFDEKLNRVGMGGGFYDRAFANLNKPRANADKPLLIGCAFECQKVDQIIPSPWDVKLTQVVSEVTQYLG